MVHLALQLLIARGDDDGIVDVRAHLDGADDQIAEEEQVFARDRRDGEVDPDTALNDEDQQQRHARGFEREQQDDEHDEHRDDADDRVVDGEGLFKVVFVRAVARDVDRAVGIVFLGDLMHEVGELIRLVAADGQVQIDEHSAEVLALKLVLRAGHLHLRVVQHRGLLVRERDEAGIDLIAGVEQNVDERDLIIGEVPGQLAIILLIGGIGRVDHLGHLIVQPGQLCELPRRELVGEHIAVHGLDVRQAHRRVDLIIGGKLFEDGAFLVIIPSGHDEGDHVCGGEGVLDHVLRDLRLVELRRGEQAVTVGIRAARRELEAEDDEDQEDGGHKEARCVVVFADEGDFRDEAAVRGAVDERAEEHQQPRHHKKRRQQREGDGLNEADGHVRAELELHEQHRDHAADRGEAARADLRDGLADHFRSCDLRLPGWGRGGAPP